MDWKNCSTLLRIHSPHLSTFLYISKAYWREEFHQETMELWTASEHNEMQQGRAHFQNFATSKEKIHHHAKRSSGLKVVMSWNLGKMVFGGDAKMIARGKNYAKLNGIMRNG